MDMADFRAQQELEEEKLFNHCAVLNRIDTGLGGSKEADYVAREFGLGKNWRNLAMTIKERKVA